MAVEALPGWAEDWPGEWLAPLLASCRKLLDPAAAALPGADARPRAPLPDWRPACDEAAAIAGATDPDQRDGAMRALLRRHLRVVPAGTGLLTGYYEPELRGALRPHGPYRTPLRALPPPSPDGMLPDRAAIEAGALAKLGLELAWVDDPVDAFFLQIQGSGRLRLAEGGVLRLGYAGKNGHPYRSIGRILIERGAIAREAMSMQAIRAWLAAAPPAERTALLRQNPSYVFFRILDGLAAEEGPIGTLGVPLTPLRSLAVDPAHIPLGAPVWVVARDPLDGRPIRRLTLAQDTGGAIRGPARGDLFWGWGEAAGTRAGLMQDREARLFVLLPVRSSQTSPATPTPSGGTGAALD